MVAQVILDLTFISRSLKEFLQKYKRIFKWKNVKDFMLIYALLL